MRKFYLAMLFVATTTISFGQWAGSTSTTGSINRQGKVFLNSSGWDDHLEITRGGFGAAFKPDASGGFYGLRLDLLGAGSNFYIMNGNFGIGLTNPSHKLHVDGDLRLSGSARKLIVGTEGSIQDYLLLQDVGVGPAFQWVQDGSAKFTIEGVTGNLGIGTSSPSGKLHISGVGSNLNIGNASMISGDLIVESKTGARSTTSGAQLEFVIPANTDGTNLWGQGRIITVAGTSTSGNATGKMIFGTRRWFSKLGGGSEWFYGDDIAIDGVGNVGIGTVTPDAKLTVKGVIHTMELNIDVNGALVPDYVFEKKYDLKSIGEVENFINTNKHLPEVPSAKEMEEKGMDVKALNLMLLKKIEELTLYMIELKKENEKQNVMIEELRKGKNTN